MAVCIGNWINKRNYPYAHNFIYWLIMWWPLAVEFLCLICAYYSFVGMVRILLWLVQCYVTKWMEINTNINTAERHTTYSASLNTWLGLCATHPVWTALPCSCCSKCFGQGGNLAALSNVFWCHVVVTLHFSQEVGRVHSTNFRIVLIGMNLAHNVFLIYILIE